MQKELGIDNVDECRDWQVNLDADDLVQLTVHEAVNRLFEAASLMEGEPIREPSQRVGIFVRV
jgi:hypothetical protein